MEMSLNPAGIEVPVLLIFFCRPEPFAETFAAVRKARPSRLFLYQDGPREGVKHDSDVAGIIACRKIAESIDWECEVQRFYQEKNIGCDPSEYIAQKWAFGQVEKCIVLEDDDVVSPSFFPYCKELLDRYEFDERVGMICGMNHLGEYHANGCSYFFTNTGAITGWASWRRVVQDWEPKYDSLDDPYVLEMLGKAYNDIGLQSHLPHMLANKADGREYYETILGLSRFTQHRLCIVPAVNLVKNVGNCAEATHTSNSTHWIYSLPHLNLEMPLRHPRYVINDVTYSEITMRKFSGNPSWLRMLLRKNKLLQKIKKGIFG